MGMRVVAVSEKDSLYLQFALKMMSDMGFDVYYICNEKPQYLLPIKYHHDTDVKRVRDFVDSHASYYDALLLEANNNNIGISTDRIMQQHPKLIVGITSELYQATPAVGELTELKTLALSGFLSKVNLASDKTPMIPTTELLHYFGYSMSLVNGVLFAIYQRMKTGKGQKVENVVAENLTYLMSFPYGLKDSLLWSGDQGQNVLDGAAPFYGVYKCKDGRYVAIGTIESKFYRNMINRMREVNTINEEKADELKSLHMNLGEWEYLRQELKNVFLQKTRDEWVEIFKGKDATVTPVLSVEEVPNYQHFVEKELFASSEVNGKGLYEIRSPLAKL